MFEEMSEEEARSQILSEVSEYCDKFHSKKPYHKGDRIPYASRVYDHSEMTNLVDSSLEFWLTTGRYTDEFEKKLANYLNIRFCNLVNSGSSANLIAFMTLTSPLLGDRAIRRGDEVITVAAGFPTTVTPIIQFGAVPVFVDVTIPQYNINVDMLEKAYSSKTKAVMLAHTLGNPFDLESVKSFCDRHGLWLIEDNCDAIGSKYAIGSSNANSSMLSAKGNCDTDSRNCVRTDSAQSGVIATENDSSGLQYRFTGTIGDIGTSSFYPPHHMTMGEGGAVYTDNPLLNRIIRSMRDWGRDCICPSGHDNLCGHRFTKQYGELPFGYDHKYVYSHFGYNLKATDMQAAIGCAQLDKLPLFAQKRRSNFAHMHEILEDTEDQLILPERAKNSDPCWFGFMMTCREQDRRDKLVQYLEQQGIQTRMLFAGNLTKHPCFDEMRRTGQGYRIAGSLDCTDRIMKDTFWVGVYPGMTDEMLDYMAEHIHKGLKL